MARRGEQTGEKVRRGGFDMPFFVLVMILLTFGLIMVFSASYVSAYYNMNDSFYFVKQQLFAALLGMFVMAAVIVGDYRWLKKVAVPLMGVSILLLVAVLFIGTTRNNATRWIYIGSMINFQPSEITKVALVIFFSHYISTYQKYMKSFVKGILPYVTVLGIISFLLIKEPHYSATLLICAVGMIMVFVGGGSLKWFIGMGTAGGAGLLYLILFTNYTKARIESWLHPEAAPRDGGYQILQSLYAIGSGGLMGLGLGQSRQKYLYLPEAHNDFIFAITCEELGFIGAAFVMILFALLIWRGFVIAFRAQDKFGSMLVVGIISLVALQFLINIAVVTNFMPVTGMPLPFFSHGGTSLLILLFQMGIVLNVSRYAGPNNRG